MSPNRPEVQLDARFLLSPGDPLTLTFAQVLAVSQAFGLPLGQSSAEVSVQAAGDHVVLLIGSQPHVWSRAVWRETLEKWRPVPVVPEKG
jgi:hypothetical protein